MLLKDAIRKEIFIVTGSEDEESEEIKVFATWKNLILHLNNMNAAIDSDTRVFHGILSPAEVLPSSFKGKSIFVVCLDPTDKTRTKGCLVESVSDTPADLGEEIESVISMGESSHAQSIDIDDIYILYGYQLEVCLSINEEEIDEEILHTCKKIHKDVMTIAEMAGRRNDG